MWDWAIWGALLVAGLAGIAALALFAMRAWNAWRDVRDRRTDGLRRLDEFARKAEAVADRLQTAGNTAELQSSRERLRVSLAKLAVLQAALDEVDGTLGRVTAYVPRK
jgi:hypothetical protein